jgi:hypothetical protein
LAGADVEDDQGCGGVLALDAFEKTMIPKEAGPVLRNIPIEIEAVREGGGDDFRQRRFSGLARSGKEDHALF